jgi:ferritin-like metal-binding protein YciE
MPTQSLRELYIDELHDLYSAEGQIIEALPKMAAAAKASELKQAFSEHLEQTRVHRERLDLIFKQLNERSDGERCEGMAGLLEEGAGRIRLEGPDEVRDAGLIAAAQRVEHYEIAAYGTARTFARILGAAARSAVSRRRRRPGRAASRGIVPQRAHRRRPATRRCRASAGAAPASTHDAKRSWPATRRSERAIRATTPRRIPA